MKNKISSVTFLFEDESRVVFVKGCDKIYDGANEKFKGKNFYYTVYIRTADGDEYVTNTFYFPSQQSAMDILSALGTNHPISNNFDRIGKV